jgi:acetyl-CoA carboxylase biotin carboxyl carrier protein
MEVTRKDIDLLANSMKENSLTSIEYADDNFSLKLGCHEFSGNPFVVNNEKSAVQPSKSSMPKEEKVEETSTGKEIKTPLVGNFFITKKPGDPAFIKVGDKVKEGDVIAIIEAMKVMNEVKSPVSGVVESIEIENGTFVDADTIIMYIK